MYLTFFGLNEKPFAITPDPRYLYLSERHAEALAHLLYGINEAGGFVQLTGEVGTGKTTIVRSLLAQTPKNAEIALILNPRMTAPEFLLTICQELGIGVPDAAGGSLKDLVHILSDSLLRAHAAGKRVVLVVDEAQNLSPDVLEQVRLLTNLETNTQKLLQIILIGQPELRELLSRNELRQLAQRITGRYHLNPLSHDESVGYVRHRLRGAGATSDIFPPAAPTAVRPAPAPHLAELLAQHAAETDTDSAFARLLALWGAKYQANSTDPCSQATQQGLECVIERGSFGQLRLYNRPAILMLSDGAGTSHQVVLTALDDEQARLELGGARSVGLGELSHFWLGDFVVLWRPASSPVKALSAGMRGAQVRWLRRSLQRLQGVADNAPASDVFDAELTGWARDFQRRHQLAVDGIAGVRTQIALAGAVGGADTPLLSAADTDHHGG